MERETIDLALEKNTIKVELYDGLKIYIVGKANDHLVGKFFPCAKNSREYIIQYADIKEITNANPEIRVPTPT